MQPEDLFYRDVDGVPTEVDIYNTPNTGVNDIFLTAIYGQDSWTLNNRLTLNLGFRLDRYVMGWPDQSMQPTHQDIFPALEVSQRDVLTMSNIGPRLGAAFDVTGKGRDGAEAVLSGASTGTRAPRSWTTRTRWARLRSGTRSTT